MNENNPMTTIRECLIDLANRALLASVAGRSLKVTPDEFVLLKRLNDEEWDASVIGAWRIALADHPITQHLGMIGQPETLSVEVVT